MKLLKAIVIIVLPVLLVASLFSFIVLQTKDYKGISWLFETLINGPMFDPLTNALGELYKYASRFQAEFADGNVGMGIIDLLATIVVAFDIPVVVVINVVMILWWVLSSFLGMNIPV